MGQISMNLSSINTPSYNFLYSFYNISELLYFNPLAEIPNTRLNTLEKLFKELNPVL